MIACNVHMQSACKQQQQPEARNNEETAADGFFSLYTSSASLVSWRSYLSAQADEPPTARVAREGDYKYTLYPLRQPPAGAVRVSDPGDPSDDHDWLRR